MKTLYIGFRGKNNTSSQIVNQLGEDILLLTNSFSGLEKDILSITESYGSIYMFGVDSSLKGTLRIEKFAEFNGITVSSVYDVAQLSKIMDGYGIVNSISKETLIKSARAVSERFFLRQKNGKQRNTVCISCFSFCMDGEKDKLSSRRRFIQRFPNVPTQYLCNAAYYHMLCINKNAVFIHVPSIKGMNDALMDRLLTLFRKIPFDT